MVWGQQKTSQETEDWGGGSNKSFHVHVSRHVFQNGKITLCGEKHYQSFATFDGHLWHRSSGSADFWFANRQRWAILQKWIKTPTVTLLDRLITATDGEDINWLLLHSLCIQYCLTCCVSMASSLLSSPSRSELTSLSRSLSLFQITCTFSWASRHSLPWAWICSEDCDCSSGVWALVVTSSWAESSWRDDTFCCDSSSSCLICCGIIKRRGVS